MGHSRFLLLPNLRSAQKRGLPASDDACRIGLFCRQQARLLPLATLQRIQVALNGNPDNRTKERRAGGD